MIDLNTTPYFDDFDESKGYYKILFRPGYAVQARELTQLQTILQNQISRFGSHIFKDGSLVLNGSTYTSTVYYINVVSSEVDNFASTNIIGATSGASAKTIAVANSVSEGVSRIYFAYTNGLLFSQNEVITNDNNETVSIIDDEAFTGFATSFSIEDSVFFINGHFVFCNGQTKIIGTDDEPVSARVGLLATESITSFATDESLLDPARGTFNFSAPGANRYTISLDLISYPYSQSDTDTDNATEDFIELSRYLDGVQVSVNKFPSYAELENTLARRTFDESGDYTVRAFNLKVEDNIRGDNTLLSLKVEPGKAYVKGYEFETVSPTYIDLSRARETRFNNSFPVTINYGTYFYIYNPAGAVDYTSNPTANVYLSTSMNPDTVIGTVRLKHISYDTSVGANDVYRLYVDNLSLNAGNSIANIRAIGTGSAVTTPGIYHANIDVTQYEGNLVTLATADNTSYIIPLPKDYVANTVITETIYSSLRAITGVTFTTDSSNTNAGPISITSPHTFITGLDSEDYIITVTAVSSGTIPIGTRLNPDNYYVDVTSESSVNISYSGGYANNSTFTATVIAPTVIRNSPSFKTKTLTTSSRIITGGANTAHWANLIRSVSLQKSDIYRLTSVLVYDDQANVFYYDSSYDLNNGQTDLTYEHGTVTLKTGASSPAFDYANVKTTIYSPAARGNIANVTFNFEYFTHTGTGPLTVDSYASSGVDYINIPEYKSPTGVTYDLRSCFDFRARLADGGTTYTSGAFGAPDTTLFTDFYNYLGRKSRLVLTKERKLTLVDGVADEYPSTPLDVPDAMTLYIINIPPYTINKDEVTFQYVDNRRYTMRDIGKIEKRIEKLEYYTALSLLEKQASEENIVDSATTLDRFKNGILVDSFAGHSVGDVSSADYRCSIDYENRILRPRFSSQSFNFKRNTVSTDVKQGDLVTVDYNTETFLNQPLASSWVNLNPYNVFTWNGVVELDPANDTWVDTITRPDVTVNINGENDVFTQLASSVSNPASVGVKWNDWQTVVNGTSTVLENLSTSSSVSTSTSGGSTLQTTTSTTTGTQTTTSSETVARVGLEISTGGTRTITRDLGTKVVDTSIVPFIRSRVVNFKASGLKPTTTLSAYFDGINVTSFCFPATQIRVTGTIPPSATSVRLTSNTSITGRIIMTRPDRIFVRMTEGLIYQGNSIAFLNSAGTNVGTATANTVTYFTDTGTIAGNVTLQTNEAGDIAGSFLIPSNSGVQFRTGEREFRLTDSLINASTAAASKYVALGMSQTTERNFVSTRVSTVSINPVLETTVRNSSVSTPVVVSTSQEVVDITPPPPPRPLTLQCGMSNTGGSGRHTFDLNFGLETGTCGIRFSAVDNATRYTIIWNGNEYSTGFMGDSSFNNQLRALGFPNIIDGPARFELKFNKTLASPSTATLIIDAPLQGTRWSFGVECPATPVVQPTPTIEPTYDFTLSNSINTTSTSDEATSTSVFPNGSVVIPREGNLSSTGAPLGSFVVPIFITPRDFNNSALTVRYSLTTSSGDFYLDNQIISNLFGPSFARGIRESISSNRSCGLVVPSNSRIGVPINVSVSVTAEWFLDQAGTVSTGITRTRIINFNYLIQTRPPQIDPVAQTFFVDAKRFPNGLFLDSIDLYFKSKSSTLPVTVQLRPVVNGYPSSSEVVPFSVVSLSPTQVNTSTTGSVATNFKFPSPVYLPAGEHCFVALCDTTDYEIFTAKIGDFLLSNPVIRITQQPAIGSMFKSQNSSTWTPVQEEDVMFRLNKCVFDTESATDVTLDLDIPSNYGNMEYDVFYASGETIDFAATEVQFQYKTYNLDNVEGSYAIYQAGSNVTQSERKHVRNNRPTDLQVRAILSTSDRNISPVIDLNRFSAVLVQNTINNDSTGETNPTGGNAVAKYVSRKVTLAPGFESMDLKAYMRVNKPTNTDIEVYYKVATVGDTLFDDNEWQQMALESAGAALETGFVEYKYKTPSNKAFSTGDRFKTFAIKIVMLSSDPVRVPQIRDLRVIALDE